MVEFLGRVAWKAHALAIAEEFAGERRPLTSLHVKNLVDELGPLGGTLELIEKGVILTLSRSLGDGEAELHFSHKSFREFLVAKHYESRLARIIEARGQKRQELERELTVARFFDGETLSFLLGLCERWPAASRRRLVDWAEGAFNDERLSGETIRSDRRYLLREVGLALCSGLGAGLVAEHEHTLASLMASYSIHRGTRLFAANVSSVGAQLTGANLSNDERTDLPAGFDRLAQGMALAPFADAPAAGPGLEEQ